MPNARKVRKQSKLRERQREILTARFRCLDDEPADRGWIPSVERAVAVEMDFESPYQTFAQDRHERRVLGHSALDCTRNGCTIDKIDAAISWNQPPSVFGGEGRRRRKNNRKKSRS